VLKNIRAADDLLDTKEASTYSVIASRLIRSRRQWESKQEASLAGASSRRPPRPPSNPSRRRRRLVR
jgi:hypothetical protein